MISKEVLVAARRLQFRCRSALRDFAFGARATPLRGRGIEFDEARPYQMGDEARDIDWKVTARRMAPFVKRFVEERQTSVWLVLDETPSMNPWPAGQKAAPPRPLPPSSPHSNRALFADDNESIQIGVSEGQAPFKRRAAIEALAVLALAAQGQQDRVGLITFGPRSALMPPRSGRHSTLAILNAMLDPAARPTHQAISSLPEAMRRLRRHSKGRVVLVVASDFLYSDPLESLRPIVRRHDCIVIHPIARWERSLPDAGPIRLRDTETGEMRWMDGASRVVRESYQRAAVERESRLATGVRELHADYIAVPEDQNGVDAVMRHFARFGRSR